MGAQMDDIISKPIKMNSIIPMVRFFGHMGKQTAAMDGQRIRASIARTVAVPAARNFNARL